MYERAEVIIDTTSISAESRAILQGIEYSVNNNIIVVLIETNNLIMNKILDEEWKAPWSIVIDVEKIKYGRTKGECQVRNIAREENQLADFFTNYVLDFAGIVQFTNFWKLPTRVRRIINAKKISLPNLRFNIYITREPD